MKIGILTCKEIPQLTEDDHLFVKLLGHEGIEYTPLIWNETEPEDLDVDAILLRSPWDYQKEHENFLAFLKKCTDLKIKVINDYKTIAWNYDKNYMKELSQKGVPIVDTLFFKTREEFDKLKLEMEKRKWQNIVVKPTISATANLTTKTSVNDEELLSHALEVLTRSEGMIQPFISSIQTDGEVSLVYFYDNLQPTFSHALIKKAKGQDFRVQVDFGGSIEPFEPGEHLLKFGFHALKQVTTPWLYARVDIVDWRKEPKLGELEMIEPALYFSTAAAAAPKFIHALKHTLTRSLSPIVED